MHITLDFSGSQPYPVDLQGFQPAEMLAAPPLELASRRLLVGNRLVPLGDACRVQHHPGGWEGVILTGNTVRVINAGRDMQGGCLLVEGDAGPYAGAGMKSGKLTVRGSAGEYLGAGMSDGYIHVSGDCGGGAGSDAGGMLPGMHGGSIFIEGSAGCEAGCGMRRGLLVITDRAGSMAGAGMQAGTVIIFGEAGSSPGINMKRGSLVLGGIQEGIPAGFIPAGEGDPAWLGLYLRHIQSMNMTLPQDWITGRWKRWTGDQLCGNKGEIYVFDQPE